MWSSLSVVCSSPDGSSLDSSDLENRQPLTVALALVVTGLVLELVDADLGTLGVLEHFTGHGDLGQRGGIGGDARAVDDALDVLLPSDRSRDVASVGDGRRKKTWIAVDSLRPAQNAWM